MSELDRIERRGDISTLLYGFDEENIEIEDAERESIQNDSYGFSLRKAEIFDRRDYGKSSTGVVYRITKIAGIHERILDIVEQNLFGDNGDFQ